MTVYLLVLLAATLAVVWGVIDRVTAHALAEREAVSAKLFENQYKERVREERERTDQALLQQAKELANIMQSHYRTQFSIELAKFHAASATGPLMFLTTAPWAFAVEHPGAWGRPNSYGAVFRMYFSNLALPDELIQHFDDENRATDFHQINSIAGREWRSASLRGRALPFDPKEIDNKAAEPGKTTETANVIDWVIRDSHLTNNGEPVRRVLLKVPYFGGNLPIPRGRPGGPGMRGGFGAPGGPPPPRSALGAWAEAGGPSPTPNTDTLPRLYVQCARPQAVLDAKVGEFAAERDEELQHLSGEIARVRQKLQLDITALSLIAFLAVAVGGPLLVGRGLRPVGKLSDAVSRVSEKDFKLPHDGSNLAVELVPIHGRLTQTLDLLQRAFAREKQAVADISHELRTPIAALMATIDVALRKPRTPEQYRTALEECKLISKQLGELVERIMTLASLDANNDRVQIARTDAAELTTGCAAVIRPLATANSISVELQVDGPLEIETDAGKLREVLMNLLHNAIEYNRPDGVIELCAWRDGAQAIFEVRDTGLGMTPAVQEKIFERFYRADPSRHATGIHAGLGLAIVKEYVARLNGTIAVSTTPGVGSTFRVTIPAPVIATGNPSAAESVGAAT